LALNITFTCNTVKDELGNNIDCKYQVYYPEHGIFNTVRDTSFSQYNCNAGDADSLSQTGSFLSGEHAVLMFWQGDGAGGLTGPDRTGLKDRLAYYVIPYDGVSTTYVIDVVLKPKNAPTSTWNLVTAATINRTVTGTTTATDEETYTDGITTFYHYRNYGSTVIFDSISNLTETYDFGDGAGYASTNVHNYIVVADYVANHKVVNAYNLSSITPKNIRLKYNVPIGGLSFNPNGISPLVYMNDSIITTAAITDEDARITNIDHHWITIDKNTSTVKSDITEASNVNLVYAYTDTIPSLDIMHADQIITWNDGWNVLTFTYSQTLTVTNILPTVTISKADLSTKDKRFSQVSSDVDGTIVNYEWVVYVILPFSGVYSQVYSTSNTTGAAIDLSFNETGSYKTVLTVTDDVSGQSSAETLFDITSGGTCTGITSMNDEVYFIFPDVLGQ